MKNKLELALSRDGLRIMAEVTDWMIGQCEDNTDSFLRQVILVDLLRKKLEIWRWEQKPQYKLRFSIPQVLAWYNEIIRHGNHTVGLDIHAGAVIQEITNVFERAIQNMRVKFMTQVNVHEPDALERVPIVQLLGIREDEED